MATDHEQGNCGVVNGSLSQVGLLPRRPDRPFDRARVLPYSRGRLAYMQTTAESLPRHLPLNVVLDRALEIGREMEELLHDADMAHNPGPHCKVVTKKQDPPQ
jgi:hypothetical protein